MEPIAKEVERSFFLDLLKLCRGYGVSIGCSDPYEVLVLEEYSRDFEDEFKAVYL